MLDKRFKMWYNVFINTKILIKVKNMQIENYNKPIIIPFEPNNKGRIMLKIGVLTKQKSFISIEFKLATGSAYTILSLKDLKYLGYTEEFLSKCDIIYPEGISETYRLGYIENLSLKFENMEIKNYTVFFSFNDNLCSMLGSDILKYFNIKVDNDLSELTLILRNK